MSVASLMGVIVVMAMTVSCAPRGGVQTLPGDRAMTVPALVPLPAKVEWRSGGFVLAPETVIVAPGELEPIGQLLSEYIGLGVGRVRLQVQAAAPEAGPRIVLRLADDVEGAEQYRLEVTGEAITIAGRDRAGVFYGIQTLRQMLPARFEYEALRYTRGDPPAVTVPAVSIADGPRFEWRGAMLDVARHFLGVDEVKRYIDLMALHKLNRLHLHLSDDQGWRIEITSWPNLTQHGGSTEVDGGPGGFFTQDQYADIVRYAAARSITVVPEIDMPGHTNAALASYAELNCDAVARPLYTGIEVGFSALCVDSERTYAFINDVVREIAALTPGPYFHIGGDEVKTLSREAYSRFIQRVQPIVRSHGKRVIGWDEIASAALVDGAIVQQWRPTMSPAQAIARGASVVMSPADRVYLDMKYHEGTPIGLMWAGLTPVERSYDWDPANTAADVPASAVLGVEAPLWTETIATINDAEFLAFPRLAAVAEVAWTPQSRRDWSEFRERLGAQAPRWRALGINFYPAPEIPWTTQQ